VRGCRCESIHLAQDRDQWRTLVNTEMNLRHISLHVYAASETTAIAVRRRLQFIPNKSYLPLTYEDFGENADVARLIYFVVVETASFERYSLFQMTCSRFVGSEVFTGLWVQIDVFWVLAPCSVSAVYQHSGGTYHLHPQHQPRSPPSKFMCWIYITD
jgi:hypothetical protein